MGSQKVQLFIAKFKKMKRSEKEGVSPHPAHTYISPPAVPPPLNPRVRRLYPMHIRNGPGEALGAACTRGREEKGREGDAFAQSDHHHKELKRE